MKYCPFCGATLMGGTASFCSACGKSISAICTMPAENPISPVTNKPAHTTNKTSRKIPKTKRTPRKKRSLNDSNEIIMQSTADGYDGYYEDVPTMDNGHEKERMDPELIKKIILVATGASLVIILAIIVMLLL